LVWSKFWLVFVPLLLLGELLIFLSNLLLHVPSWMMVISLITVFLMTFGITAIGIGLGALYPNFNYENAAEIPTSFGGAIAMILSVAFIAAGNDRCQRADCISRDRFVTHWHQTSRAVKRLKPILGAAWSSFTRYISPAVRDHFRLC
jgi:hypothetical protein